MDPDWRIVVELALETSAVELEALLAAGLPGDAAVSRAGRVVYLYARERHVAAVLHELVRRHEISSQPRLERWNPGRDEWQDPELAVEPAPIDEEVTLEDIEALAWEVRARRPRKP